ncbi:MAG: tRNA preQ1(34) S-adenosylmethionine ribosyltransferase-isomerase QueA [Oscillospiraceae bacterium]|jgi:S-adenosylmethionine:tRNA ribosyltransferase-isomerase|nr:tRNA preQ1(34) S-adenosylmethionine ribosyltransferase-isomerase QueA [Oscillospiraceae bacterium]
MKKSDFYYDLPKELIAQTPAERRDGSRLMTLDKLTGEVGHRRFYELPELLRPGDCLVLNDSRVIPARLSGRLASGAAVEIVLLRDTGGGVWDCLARPGRKVRAGARVVFGDGKSLGDGKSGLEGEVTGVSPGGNRLIKFEYDGVFLELIESLGTLPLPPYIKTELRDAERYQTVYSREPGAAAAPTAGLHFTKELLAEIGRRGVAAAYVTLNVGLGTFRPVKADNIEEHEMHSEYFTVPRAAAELVNAARARGGRIVAVGTTSCRVVESASGEDGMLRELSGFTDIFIYPGYRFKCADALITNFHLPESTLIMLVAALAGRENALAAYETAIRERYRFFSFGDAMLIR